MELPSHPQCIPDLNINSLLHMLYLFYRTFIKLLLVWFITFSNSLISLPYSGPFHWLPFPAGINSETLLLVFQVSIPHPGPELHTNTNTFSQPQCINSPSLKSQCFNKVIMVHHCWPRFNPGISVMVLFFSVGVLFPQ